MTHKIVLRVLDDGGQVLAWAEVQAEARGDGCLWAPGPIVCEPCEMPGAPRWVSYHWTALNVETRVAYAGAAVQAGDVIALQCEAPLIVVGPPAGGLPPVIVRRRTVIAPVAGVVGAA